MSGDDNNMKTGHRLSEETKEKIKRSHLGVPRPKEAIKKMVETRKKNGNYQSWNKGLVGYKSGEEHYNWKGGTGRCVVCNKLLSGHKQKYCIYHRPKLIGENNPAWKGGVTPLNRSIRTSAEYVLWRKSVFERDNYTCVWCGKRGGIIDADHIKPFSRYPELRFAIDNGRTLCRKCHKTTHTYGNKIKK